MYVLCWLLNSIYHNEIIITFFKFNCSCSLKLSNICLPFLCNYICCIKHNFDFAICSPRTAFRNDIVHRRKPGAFHHLAFRATSRQEVDELYLKIKAPILGKSTVTAEFRCAKRKCSMIQTDDDENTLKTIWKVSCTLSQKKKVEGQ